MGKRGPAPTPTAILEQHGSWRAGLRTNEPQFEDGLPECPDWLRPDAQKVWDFVVPELARVPGLLKAVDGMAIARYVTNYAKWLECERFLAKKGPVIPIRDASGKVRDMKPAPQARLAIQLDQRLEAMEKQFGLSASARAGLAVAMAENEPAGDNIIQMRLRKAN